MTNFNFFIKLDCQQSSPSIKLEGFVAGILGTRDNSIAFSSNQRLEISSLENETSLILETPKSDIPAKLEINFPWSSWKKSTNIWWIKVNFKEVNQNFWNLWFYRSLLEARNDELQFTISSAKLKLRTGSRYFIELDEKDLEIAYPADITEFGQFWNQLWEKKYGTKSPNYYLSELKTPTNESRRKIIEKIKEDGKFKSVLEDIEKNKGKSWKYKSKTYNGDNLTDRQKEIFDHELLYNAKTIGFEVFGDSDSSWEILAKMLEKCLWALKNPGNKNSVYLRELKEVQKKISSSSGIEGAAAFHSVQIINSCDDLFDKAIIELEKADTSSGSEPKPKDREREEERTPKPDSPKPKDKKRPTGDDNEDKKPKGKDKEPEKKNSESEEKKKQQVIEKLKKGTINEIVAVLNQYPKLSDANLSANYRNWQEKINGFTDEKEIVAFKGIILAEITTQRKTKKEEEKITENLATEGKNAEQLKEQLAETENYRGQQSYENKQPDISNLKDKLAKVVSNKEYQTIIVNNIKKIVTKYDVKFDELEPAIKEEWKKLENGEILETNQVNEAEKKIIKKVGEKAAEKKLSKILDLAWQSLKSQKASEIEKSKKELNSFLTGSDIFEKLLLSHKENEVKKMLKDLENFTTSQNPDTIPKNQFSPIFSIVIIGSLLIIFLIVLRLIIKKKKKGNSLYR